MKKKFNSKFKLLIATVFLCLTSWGNAQEDIVRIACIGNSITQGSHLDNPLEESYPAQLSNLMSTVYGKNFRVNNYGLSGRNLLKNSPNPIWNEPEFCQALKWEPDICLILLGTNDSLPNLWEKSGDEFLVDYLTMIDTFKTRNPNTKFIIGTPPPIWEKHPYGGDTWGDKHNDSILVNYIIPKIKIVSEKPGATLIDFHTPFRNNIQLFPDYLHPNKTGAKAMAKMIFNEIKKSNMINEIKKIDN